MGKKAGKRAAHGGGKSEGARGRPTKKSILKKRKDKSSAGGKGGGKGQGKGSKKAAGAKAGAAGGARGGAKGAGKGAGKGKASPGAAAADRQAHGKKRADREADGADAEEKKTKKGKTMSAKKMRKKEVTTLYSQLINPGREGPADDIVKDILEQLAERSATLPEYCCTDLGSHVVQACLKWGSKAQRKELLTSLKEHLGKLAVDRYGHMVVLKLLRYVSLTSTERKPTAEEKKARTQNLRDLLESFRGKNLHSIFYHRQGCQVINGIYYSPAVDPKEKRRLFHEVAVPQSVALRRPELPGSKPLRQLLQAEDLAPEQRSAMLDHLREAAEKAVDKELLSIDIVHLLFQAYCEVANEAQLKDLAEKCMAGAPYLLASKAGAEALVRLLGVATAKQRKSLLKDLKGKFCALATNSVDYLVMMRMLSTIDDTVLVGKSILAEWQEELRDICFDKYGHKVLAWLLRPGDAKVFSPYELSSLALPAPTALKAADTRRQELMRVLRPHLRSALLAGPLKAAADVHAKDVLVSYLANDWDGELLEALLKECKQAAGEEECGAFGTGTATTTLLVLLSMEPDKADLGLAMPLWQRCLEPRLVAAVTTRCAFLLLGLLKRGGAVRAAVLEALRKRRKEVDAAVKAAQANKAEVKGAITLLQVADEAAAAPA